MFHSLFGSFPGMFKSLLSSLLGNFHPLPCCLLSDIHCLSCYCLRCLQSLLVVRERGTQYVEVRFHEGLRPKCFLLFLRLFHYSLHQRTSALGVAFEDLNAVLENALGKLDVALLSGCSTCHHFVKHFLRVLLRFRRVHKGACTLCMTLQNLDAILENALSEPDVALLSRYSALHHCLICLTNHFSEIQCCLACFVICH